MNFADLQQLLQNHNVAAFLRVIREKESSQDDAVAYRMISGGGLIDTSLGWNHPWDGVPTTQGGKACGAYQFLGTTWAGLVRALPGGDFSPAWQDLRCVQLIGDRNGAIRAVVQGEIPHAIELLRTIWVSLPGGSESHYTLDQALAIFTKYGGKIATQPAAPIEERPQPEKPVDPISLIAIFGGVLTQLLPMVGTLFGGKKDAQAAQAVGTVLDAVVQAHTGDPTAKANVENLGAAIHAMQSDPTTKKNITDALVTDPVVQQLIEIGGGIKRAVDDGIAIQNADRPVWYNPTFLISLLFFPMMYMIAYQVLFTIAGQLGPVASPTPWYAVVGFDPNTRTGLINLIVGFIFGGVTGVWFGTTVAAQRRTDTTTTTGGGTTTTTAQGS